MYFLTKFCRICITSNENLRDIDSCDYDSIKISEKLKVFTKTATNMDNWSAFICTKCIRKLRVSYEFDRMCKKSSVILRQYLTELFSCTDNNNTGKFENSEVQIQVEKLPQVPTKRKYLKRETRCSLLKDLLTKIKDDRKKFDWQPSMRAKHYRSLKKLRRANAPGGLRPLLQFTRSYNYGYKVDNKLENVKFDSTPLDKLTDFVNNFFKISLSRFHERITSVLEETEEWFEESDDFDEMLKPCEDEPVKFEEVIVEPDISIKKEIITDDVDDENMEFEVSYAACSSATTHVKLEKNQIKTEPEDGMVTEDDLLATSFIETEAHYSESRNITATSSKSNAEIYPMLCQTLGRQSQSSLNLLQEFTETNFKHHNRAGYTVLQRTKRGKFPFINPQLKKQFLHQDFKCSVCNRRFKSQGYLQAHYSKMKHKP